MSRAKSWTSQIGQPHWMKPRRMTMTMAMTMATRMRMKRIAMSKAE
jgi:hypothetical protein